MCIRFKILLVDCLAEASVIRDSKAAHVIHKRNGEYQIDLKLHYVGKLMTTQITNRKC